MRIGAEPYFVGVRHRTDSPIADELGIASVAVELENESECGVTGATYDEELDGLRFVPGTARLDGVPIEASAEGGVLHLLGLDLPPRATRELVYSARPPLLGRPAPAGRAKLRGESISAPGLGLGAADRAPPGCGCGGASSELTLGGLLLMVVAALGRRAPRSRPARTVLWSRARCRAPLA